MVLTPSRVKASPQWGLPPDQLIKQIKDGMGAVKEAIEQVAETLHRIQKVKQELANGEMADLPGSCREYVFYGCVSVAWEIGR